MNEVIEQELKIENMIYEIRGKQVMLDSDLAKLYKCTNGTKDINKAVKRNIERFPEDFYFQITKEEYFDILRFQNGTLELKQGQYSKYLPYVFTEQGVAMLSSVLKSDIAILVSIGIMRAFVSMRHYISTNVIEQKYINNQVMKNTEDIIKLKEFFKNFKEKNHHIFYQGEVYDAYSVMLDIFNRSKESIVIIDNYIDKNILDILAKTKKEVLIITNKYNRIDFDKYCKQYDNVKIKISNEFHDRFIIIDKKYLYHCGASFKDLGKKCFSINKIVDSKIIAEISKYITLS